MAARRKRIKMLVEVSVPIKAGLDQAHWRRQMRAIVENSAWNPFFVKVISVKSVKAKVYPKEIDNSQRNREWLLKK